MAKLSEAVCRRICSALGLEANHKIVTGLGINPLGDAVFTNGTNLVWTPLWEIVQRAAEEPSDG